MSAEANSSESLSIDKQAFEQGVVVFKLSGELTLRTGTKFVNLVCVEIIENHCRRMAIDLTEIKYIDSFGIGLLLKCHQTMEEQKGVRGSIEYLLNQEWHKRLATVGMDKILNLKS